MAQDRIKPPSPRVLGHKISARTTAVNESNFTDTKKDIVAYEVSDQALEAAAALMGGHAKNATVAFCSGLDTCPS